MPELTPFEQNLAADTGLVMQARHGPSLPVTLISVDGAHHPMRGLFEVVSLDVTPGSAHAAVVSAAPTLHIQLHLVQHALGRPLSRRDAFVVRGITYRVQQPLEDGFGMLTIKLLEKGSDDV